MKKVFAKLTKSRLLLATVFGFFVSILLSGMQTDTAMHGRRAYCISQQDTITVQHLNTVTGNYCVLDKNGKTSFVAPSMLLIQD